MRKLRVLAEGMPPAGRHTRDSTEGREWGIQDTLLWTLIWNVMQNTVVTAQAAGSKKAKMPQDKMPLYPWQLQNGADALAGSLGDHSQEEVLDFLDNL